MKAGVVFLLVLCMAVMVSAWQWPKSGGGHSPERLMETRLRALESRLAEVERRQKTFDAAMEEWAASLSNMKDSFAPERLESIDGVLNKLERALRISGLEQRVETEIE